LKGHDEPSPMCGNSSGAATANDPIEGDGPGYDFSCCAAWSRTRATRSFQPC